MEKRMAMIEPAAWRAMDREEKLDALVHGGCLSWQGRRFAKEGERMSWGAGFEFGCSPVPFFAMSGELGVLSEALALGACPFARDAEGDGAIEAALSDMGRPSKEARERGAALLAMCWKAGAPLLDPRSESYLGEKEARNIQFDMALACFGKDLVEDAAAQGVEVEAGWLVSFAASLPMLACQAVQWGNAKNLRMLIDAGLPLGPVEVEPGAPRESLWCWLEDHNRDVQGIAEVLFAAGLDPRAAGEGGFVPLEQMRAESSSIGAARHVAALVSAIEEREQLGRAVPQVAAKRPRAAL